MDSILIKVKQVIDNEGLKLNEAADLIGVTLGSLKRHLSGEYVRSDSLARYRGWLERRERSGIQLSLVDIKATAPHPKVDPHDLLAQRILCKEPVHGHKPHFVVDLFSGCGGMSLGFDVLEDGKVFQTVLALDIDDAMVSAFNNNIRCNLLTGDVCRHSDLSQFINEAEVLAFYLDHICERGIGKDLTRKLANLPVMGLQQFKQQVASIDRDFLGRLGKIRNSAAYKHQYTQISPHVFGQTSVIGFHDSLCLPMTSSAPPVLGPVVWSDPRIHEKPGSDHRTTDAFPRNSRPISSELEQRWNTEAEKLRLRTGGTATGQLASSARRVAAFLDFLKTGPMGEVYEAWLAWRSQRDGLRWVMFNDKRTWQTLNDAYTDDIHVDLLLGGPPCQGFSRVGRGKIRSLRENKVHVQTDAEAGDQRNLLLYKYVLFVGALRPKIFLFENVRHFQAEVKTPDGLFHASEVLAEAIQAISNDQLRYWVANRIIHASRHLIPQTRERYFMCGIRSDSAPSTRDLDVPRWCLALPNYNEIPLRVALAGLPEPFWVGLEQANGADLSLTVNTTLEPSGPNTPDNAFLSWVTQDPPTGLQGRRRGMTDSHHARFPRSDDSAFFQLMGPGKRWMDYRCDRSETLAELRVVLERLRLVLQESSNGVLSGKTDSIDLEYVENILKKVDGSLSLRLLLECIDPRPGELHHHLITDNYLAKREGRHGDWLARLTPNAPCKTIMSHMAKDTYAYVHPYYPRTLSVREAARAQSFPDWFTFGRLGFVDALRIIGNAVPPLLSHQLARRTAQVLWASSSEHRSQQPAENFSDQSADLGSDKLASVKLAQNS